MAAYRAAPRRAASSFRITRTGTRSSMPRKPALVEEGVQEEAALQALDDAGGDAAAHVDASDGLEVRARLPAAAPYSRTNRSRPSRTARSCRRARPRTRGRGIPARHRVPEPCRLDPAARIPQELVEALEPGARQDAFPAHVAPELSPEVQEQLHLELILRREIGVPSLAGKRMMAASRPSTRRPRRGRCRPRSPRCCPWPRGGPCSARRGRPGGARRCRGYWPRGR